MGIGRFLSEYLFGTQTREHYQYLENFYWEMLPESYARLETRDNLRRAKRKSLILGKLVPVAIDLTFGIAAAITREPWILAGVGVGEYTRLISHLNIRINRRVETTCRDNFLLMYQSMEDPEQTRIR